MNEIMNPVQVTSKQAALDEVYRELCVRKRCFPKWIADGRVSKTDAQDRIDRLATAFDILSLTTAPEHPHHVTSTGDKTQAASV
jgi:hypothetical protein